ncbi:H(+)/Cl(-) exchange transporter 7-like isoform X2 [Watersipora subatra]|uniref:H(+)/Cl(-) exchange transporter 7-like isoform X2 n=1 Tax=Watersipora subatra TaxID=2589382 RepID=UPI00355C2DA8
MASEETERAPLLSQPSDLDYRTNLPRFATRFGSTRYRPHAVSQNGTVAADLQAMEDDANIINEHRETYIEDPEATSAAKEYTRIQEDMLLNVKYKSLDYDPCENEIFLKEEAPKGFSHILKQQVARWGVMFLIGVLTGAVAGIIDIVIEELCSQKYMLIKIYIDRCVQVENDCLIVPLLLFCALNAAGVLIAACLVVFVSPCAAGSGIPQIKCYLNGVLIPEVVRIKTLIAKAVGVMFSVVGGLAVGKEGPMIHSGAVIAAGISQGKSATFNFDLGVLEYFRSDHEKRDFVSGGAAAGVAAAFGAPVGGVLFSLEEGASFWNQALTWRILFASMTATFTLNLILSAFHGVPWSLSYPGLISFGAFDQDHSLNYNGLEIPIFLLMGCFGGLTGGLFNHINYKLSIHRIRHIYRKRNKIMEALVVAIVTAASAYLLIYLSHDCESLGKDPTNHPVQMFCKDGEYNVAASLFLQTPEDSVRSLFHDITGTYQAFTLALFAIQYFLLATWTYGLQVPSGLFIPLLLTGAAWGRLVGIGLSNALNDYATWMPIYPGKYALIGAAAQLGGVVRMTISLTVILMEATGSVTFGLPIMLVLMCSKWVGDLFNEGIYDIHVQLAGVPFLNWEAPPSTYDVPARRVMSHPVVTLLEVEKVEKIQQVLSKYPHDGFPIVDNYIPDLDDSPTFGRFRGMILRSQLLVLLKSKSFSSNEQRAPQLSLRDFRESYPRYIPIEKIDIAEEDLQKTVDLGPYMNKGSYTVSDKASLPRIFKMFRGLGLRHVVVVDSDRKVVGMVTRSDLARYRVEFSKGKLHFIELQLSTNHPTDT